MGWYGHYLLVVAYDDEAQQFWVYDSWFGTSDVPGENADRDGRNLSYAEVEEYWPQFNRNYIAVYRPEQAEMATQIVGEDMDDATMWQRSLVQAQADAASDPDNAFFWFNLGTSYNANGQYEQASTAFDQARAIGLPWRMLWYQFGPYEAYYQVGRYEDVILLADVIALADATLATKGGRNVEETYWYKGLAMEHLGNIDEAITNYRAALEVNFNACYAQISLDALRLPSQPIAGLQEHDRREAPCFENRAEFETAVSQLFAHPTFTSPICPARTADSHFITRYNPSLQMYVIASQNVEKQVPSIAP